MYFYSLYNPQMRLFFGDVISPIVSSFESRVLADGGTFEAGSCLVSQLTTLNDIAYTPEYVDPNAQAFLTATGITDITTIYAVNDLVIDLKADGLWSKMKAIYPFVGGTATTHKFNLVNSADTNGAFRLSFNGGWTHSANGATPNGTNGYANTFLNQANNLTPSNNHISIYSRTNTSATQVDCGVTNNSTHSFSQLIKPFSATYTFENGSQIPAATFTNTLGLLLGSSISSTSAKLYKNGATIASSSTTQTRAMFNNNIYLANTNVSTTNLPNVYYSTKQIAFATIGTGLTDTEASNLYTAVQAFQTTLGRQV